MHSVNMSGFNMSGSVLRASLCYLSVSVLHVSLCYMSFCVVRRYMPLSVCHSACHYMLIICSCPMIYLSFSSLGVSPPLNSTDDRTLRTRNRVRKKLQRRINLNDGYYPNPSRPLPGRRNRIIGSRFMAQ